MKTALIINAHKYYENWSEGGLNALFCKAFEKQLRARGYGIRTTVLEEGYDPVEEVDKHVLSDLIILQTPVNWFGAPWTHKKYLDEVFNAGLASERFLTTDGRSRQDPTLQYGMGGRLHGRQFMMSLTWNAPAEAFGEPQQYLYEGATADDAFVHIAACYRFCGVSVLPSFSSYDVMKNANVQQDMARLNAHLIAYLGAPSAPVKVQDILHTQSAA